MRAVPGFQKAQARLRMEGCCYRLREVARSPFAYVYELDPPQRQQVARCCRIQDDEACERLTELLLEAGKNRAAGGRGLDWVASATLSASQQQIQLLHPATP